MLDTGCRLKVAGCWFRVATNSRGIGVLGFLIFGGLRNRHFFEEFVDALVAELAGVREFAFFGDVDDLVVGGEDGHGYQHADVSL